MTHLTIREIADAWKEEKRPYVKRSTFAAYLLTLENHLLPYFGDMTELSEPTVQSFVLEKLNAGGSGSLVITHFRVVTRVSGVFLYSRKARAEIPSFTVKRRLKSLQVEQNGHSANFGEV